MPIPSSQLSPKQASRFASYVETLIPLLQQIYNDLGWKALEDVIDTAMYEVETPTEP